MRTGSRGGVTRRLVFLLDEDLASRSIVATLRGAGLEVTTVPEQFGKGCQDVDWLTKAGERRFVVLTKDKAIRRTPLEVAAVRIRWRGRFSGRYRRSRGSSEVEGARGRCWRESPWMGG